MKEAFVLIRKTQEAGHAELDTHCGEKEKVSLGRWCLGSTQREATLATFEGAILRTAIGEVGKTRNLIMSLPCTFQWLLKVLRMKFRLLSNLQGPS